MQLTDFETGRRHPSELFGPPPRVRGRKGVDASERERRADLVRRAMDRSGLGAYALASEIGCNGNQVCSWRDGKKVVPMKYMDAIEELAGGGQ